MTAASFAAQVLDVAIAVGLAVLPLTALFVTVQVTMLRLPRAKVREIMIGTAIAGLGLFLFLLGVGIGLLPFGRAIGGAMSTLDTWVVVFIAVGLGFVTAWGEPSVRILASQVESGSSGSINGTLVLAAIAIGVAFWAGVGMLRIQLDIPIVYLVVPGYALVMVLLFLNDREYVAIAADSSGVATGPIANTFLLAVALGLSSTHPERDPIVHGLGFVGLIALAPLISVLMLGLILRLAGRRRRDV